MILGHRKLCTAFWSAQGIVHGSCDLVSGNYEEDPSVLGWITTDNKTWVHHWIRRQETKHAMEAHAFPSKGDIQTRAPRQKNIPAFCWDIKGPIPAHFQKRRQMVTSTMYFAMIREKMKPVVRSKKRRVLHHDTAISSMQWPQWWCRQCNICCLNVFPLLTALIWYNAVITSSVHLKRVHAVAGSALMRRLRKAVQTYIWKQPKKKKASCSKT